MSDKTTSAQKDTRLNVDLDTIDSFNDALATLPNPDIILRNAGIQNDVYREMLYDPQIFTAYQKRKRKVLKFKHKIISDNETLAKEVAEVVTGIEPYELINGLLKALPFGYSVSEIIWGYKENKLTPISVKNRDSSKFTFNSAGDLLYKTESGDELAPYGKFIIYQNDKDDNNNPYGTSLNSRCYWYWRFKKHGWKVWGLFLEKFGDPALILKTLNVDNETVKRKLEDLGRVSVGSNIVIGADEELKAINPPSVNMIGYEKYITLADAQMAKIYLGSTLLMDDTQHGTYNTAQQHGDDFWDLCFSDATMIAKAITKHLIEPYIRFNYGDDAEVPQMVMYDELQQQETQGVVENENKEDNNKKENNAGQEEGKKKEENTTQKNSTKTNGVAESTRFELSAIHLANKEIFTYIQDGKTHFAKEDNEELPTHKKHLENVIKALGDKHKTIYAKYLTKELNNLKDEPKDALKQLGRYYNYLTDDLSKDYAKVVFYVDLYAKSLIKESNKSKNSLSKKLLNLFKKDEFVILDFKEARKLFKNKVPLTDTEYKELTNYAKQKAFSFAGATSRKISNILHKAILDNMQDGEKHFKNVAKPILESLGVTPYNKGHLANICRTNVFNVYSQGNYKAYEKVKKQFQYLMYDAIGDGRTRPNHRALDGKVFREDDPIWNRIYPPNGFNCRCSVIPLSKTDIDKQKIKVLDGKDYMDKPEYQPDVGWAFHGGRGIPPLDKNIEPIKPLDTQLTYKDLGLPKKRDDYIPLPYKLSAKGTKEDFALFTKIGAFVSAYKELNYAYSDKVIKEILLQAKEVWLTLGQEITQYEYLYLAPLMDKEGVKKQLGVIVDKKGQVREVKEVYERLGVLVYNTEV